jgi:hypothetical protein
MPKAKKWFYDEKRRAASATEYQSKLSKFQRLFSRAIHSRKTDPICDLLESSESLALTRKDRLWLSQFIRDHFSERRGAPARRSREAANPPGRETEIIRAAEALAVVIDKWREENNRQRVPNATARTLFSDLIKSFRLLTKDDFETVQNRIKNGTALQYRNRRRRKLAH